MKYNAGDKTLLGEITDRYQKIAGDWLYYIGGRLDGSWYTESEIDAIIIKPKRNIDHLMELWEAHREEDARKEFLKIIYNESMGAEEGDEIYELMKLYAEPSRYPKLTPEELKAVRWLWDGGYESIVRDGCAYACYDRVKASVLINPITNLLADSSWITPKPINLAELLAAQEE